MSHFNPPSSGFSNPFSASQQEYTFSAGSSKSEERSSKFVRDKTAHRKFVRHDKTMSSTTTSSSPFPNATFGKYVAKSDNNQNDANSVSSNCPGVIPCSFQGSTYSFCATEESIKKEVHPDEKPEPNTTSSQQMVIVSRILKGMPQSPNFYPLKGYSNVAKQSMINAWDNIFEETVNQMLSMKINGFWVDAKRVWETLEELQRMGYNVLLLRRRLVELTDVLQRRMLHRREILRLKNEAEKHRLEKRRLEFEILKLKAKVEAEKVNVEDVMAKVVKMEDELPSFNAVFTLLAMNQL